MFTPNQISATQNQFNKFLETNVSLINATVENCKQIAFLQCETAHGFIQEVATATKKMYDVKTPMEATMQAREFLVNSAKVAFAKNQEIAKILQKSRVLFNDVAAQSVKSAQDKVVASVNEMETLNPALASVVSRPLQAVLNTSKQASEMVGDLSSQVTKLANENIDVTAEVAIKTIKPVAQEQTIN